MKPEQVADQLEIRDLIAKYCDAIARFDAEAFRSVWAEDAVWVLMGRTCRGPDEIVDFWTSIMNRLEFIVQMPGAGRVKIDGDRGRGRWYLSETGKDKRGAAITTLVLYHDEYVRARAGWCFAGRRGHIIYMGPPDLSAPLNPPECGAEFEAVEEGE